MRFKRLKQYCCCLVLYNCDKPIVLLVGIPLNVITDSGERENTDSGERERLINHKKTLAAAAAAGMSDANGAALAERRVAVDRER